jgi:hypothetical protein
MVKRICSTVETTKQRLGDLRHHLKRRGYNDKVIESGFSKASEINRNASCYGTLVRVAIGDSTCNACHHMVYWPTVDEGLDSTARSDHAKKTLLSVSQHVVSPGHSLEDFTRSKIYIIDHNPNWIENQRRKKREFLDQRVTNITSGRRLQSDLKNRHVTMSYRDVIY